MGDREGLASYLGISTSLVPASPESLDDPKRALVALARQCRRKDIREDMVPYEGSSAPVGPGYLARVREFADAHWRPDVASQSSPSLARCVAALNRILAASGERGSPASAGDGGS
jgi:hypothetical protein